MRNGLFPLRRLSSPGLAFLAVLVVVLASCEGNLANEPALVNLGTTQNEVNLLILVAQDRGYFAANNVEIVHTLYTSGVAAIAALLDHEVDLAAGSEFAFAGQVLAGRDIYTIASINRSAVEHLVARMDRGINNIADLRGRTVGVPLGSRPEFALHRFLYFHDIDISELALVDVPVDQSVDALVTGRVDAVAAWQPYTEKMRDQLDDNVVSWSVQEDQPSYTLIMSRAKWTSENRETITRFLKALVQAEDYVASHPENAMAFLQEKWDYDQGYVADVWPDYHYSVLLDQALIVTLEDQARWIMSRDPAGGQEMPDFASHIYAGGLEAVKPEAVDLIH